MKKPNWQTWVWTNNLDVFSSRFFSSLLQSVFRSQYPTETIAHVTHARHIPKSNGQFLHETIRSIRQSWPLPFFQHVLGIFSLTPWSLEIRDQEEDWCKRLGILVHLDFNHSWTHRQPAQLSPKPCLSGLYVYSLRPSGSSVLWQSNFHTAAELLHNLSPITSFLPRRSISCGVKAKVFITAQSHTQLGPASPLPSSSTAAPPWDRMPATLASLRNSCFCSEIPPDILVAHAFTPFRSLLLKLTRHRAVHTARRGTPCHFLSPYPVPFSFPALLPHLDIALFLLLLQE